MKISDVNADESENKNEIFLKLLIAFTECFLV